MTTKPPAPPRPLNPQSGIVSLMVTMVLMIVISLIVLGFAQVSRREQGQSLDRQLSSQAFFAAETGVNDAISAIHKNLNDGIAIEDKTECKTDKVAAPGNQYAFDSVLNADSNVSYPCLLVTTKMEHITGSLAAPGTAVQVPLHPAGGNISTLHFKWAAATPGDVTKCATSLPATNEFSKTDDWKCPYGVLRVDIVPTDTLSRTDLMNNQRAVFFYPTQLGATPVSPYNTLKGKVQAMACNADECSVDISGVTGSTDYSLRLSAVYKGGNFDISADDAAGKPLLLKDARAVIDATGKAQDVLRRVQVSIALNADGGIHNSDYAIQSASSICKRFGYSAANFKVPGDMDQDLKNPLCRPQVAQPCVAVEHDIALVLDASVSMENQWETGTRLDKMIEVATNFINYSGVSATSNHEATIQFNDNGRTLQPLTSNKLALTNSLGDIDVQLKTIMSEGLKKAQEEFSSPAARTTAQKVVILIGDGEPQPAKDGPITLATAKTMKDDQGVVIYTVGILKDSNKNNILEDIASPGNFTLAEDEDALKAALESIASGLVCT